MGTTGGQRVLRRPVRRSRRGQPRMAQGPLVGRAKMAFAGVMSACSPTHDIRCALVWGGAGLVVGSVVLIAIGVHLDWPMWLRGRW